MAKLKPRSTGYHACEKCGGYSYSHGLKYVNDASLGECLRRECVYCSYAWYEECNSVKTKEIT